MGSFLFRWPYPADHVYVTGTFDDWGKTEKLDKVGDHFEKVVMLPSADETFYYKFVVDEQWIVDENAPKENIGQYNVNNILLPHQITKQFPTKSVLAEEQQQASDLRSRIRATSNPSRVLATSHAPPGSNSGESALKEAPTVSAGGEGAPLLSKEQSEANLARWIPHVIADPSRPVTRTLSQEERAPVQPATEAATVSAGGVGAPLLTKEQSEANFARGVPHVTPDPARPVTRTLPQTDGASESKPEQKDEGIPGAFPETPAGEPQNFMVAPLPATGHSDVQSSVTTSKEDYEKAGGEGTAGGNMAILPVLPPGEKSLDSTATTSKEDYEKAGGEGTAGGSMSILPVLAPGQKSLDSNATTSKEDYEKVGDNDDPQVSVNPLPADGHKDTQSSVTTSKADYEKVGALGVAGAAVAGAGAYLASAFSKPKKEDKNIIPESSLPMNPEKTDTLDSGPFVNSAAPGTTTAALASQVPLEPKRDAQVVDADSFGKSAPAPFVSSAGPGSTTADLASQVPLEPKRDATILNTAAPEAPAVLKEANAAPFVSSSGPGTTTAALASQTPLEPKRDATLLNTTAPEAPALSKETSAIPLVASLGAGTTAAAALASQVPREPKTDATALNTAAPEAPALSKETSATPLVSSSGPGTTTAALASQVPLEQKRQGIILENDSAPPAVAAEKAAVEEELLKKVPESQATGAPASAAAAQTSYYGLATSVPETVEKSISRSGLSPEAATDSSVVTEKSAVERELQATVPVVESAGEPAPTLSAATATTAPNTATGAVTDLTDGKVANEPVPGTDTGSQAHGASAGVIAGGAAIGGTAAAAATALAVKHANRDVEPPRIADAQKPSITSEVAPATQVKETVGSPVAGIGAASSHPGVSPVAGAALSDGTEAAEKSTAIRNKGPVETSEATATEYAPPRAGGLAPGVSPAAAAALSDGTEDPTLSEEPAVKMMKQNEGVAAATTTPTAPVTTGSDAVPVHTATTVEKSAEKSLHPAAGESSTAQTSEAAGSSKLATAGESSTPQTSGAAGSSKAATAAATAATAATAAPSTPKKTTAVAGSSASTPARGTPDSSTAGDKKKKRHRLSGFIKKIFD